MYSNKVFHAFNNCHENIKLTKEISPSKFLDIESINLEEKYITKVHGTENKIPIHWSLQIPNSYKRNTIATSIASNMKEEIQTIRKKFIKADYPRPFAINQYNDKTKEQ